MKKMYERHSMRCPNCGESTDLTDSDRAYLKKFSKSVTGITCAKCKKNDDLVEWDSYNCLVDHRDAVEFFKGLESGKTLESLVRDEVGVLPSLQHRPQSQGGP